MESGLGHQTDVDAAINKLTTLVEMLVQDIQSIKTDMTKLSDRIDTQEIKN